MAAISYVAGLLCLSAALIPPTRVPLRSHPLRLCAPGTDSFLELLPSLPAATLRSLSDRGISEPTPIQRAALTRAVAGESMLLQAATGSGKSLAFLLPTLTRLGLAGLEEAVPDDLLTKKVLVVTPTRELAVQL